MAGCVSIQAGQGFGKKNWRQQLLFNASRFRLLGKKKELAMAVCVQPEQVKVARKKQELGMAGFFNPSRTKQVKVAAKWQVCCNPSGLRLVGKNRNWRWQDLFNPSRLRLPRQKKELAMAGFYPTQNLVGPTTLLEKRRTKTYLLDPTKDHGGTQHNSVAGQKGSQCENWGPVQSP